MNHSYYMKLRICLLLAIAAFSQGWAGDDEEMKDFIGGVYDGDGDFVVSGNVAVGASGAIIKSGDTYFTPHGVYRKSGNTYNSAGRTVVRAGNSFVGYDNSQVKAGNVFVGQTTAISSGSTIFRTSWASR
jgi:hypothetical protein